MKNNLPLIISLVAAVIIGCFALIKQIGFVGGIDKVQQEAVIKGHAEWVADTIGKPQFKWKECK
jgi:hypothetical protein